MREPLGIDQHDGAGDSLFREVADLYERTLHLPHNDTCRNHCDARFKRPLLPWHIGDRYESDELRLVIIGKPHREDEPTVSRDSGTQDGRETADRLFREKAWPFWSYTKAILEQVYGSEEGWRRIALTTIVKCTTAAPDSGPGDLTTERMRVACVSNNRVIQKELAILRPRRIVLYTGRGYDECLVHLPWDSRQTWTDITGPGHSIACGEKRLPWWERRLARPDGDVHVLRTGHPERMKKQDYVELVAGWILRTAQGKE